MEYSIGNDVLKVKISTKGGELQSIQDKDETEYLWQGDEKFWNGKAPNLFPYIARLTEGKYIFHNKEYKMDIHGFLKDIEMDIESASDTKLELSMRSNDVTWRQYPFMFKLYIIYEVVQRSLNVTYLIENHDIKTMFFGIGGHPGFNVPLESGIEFSEYYLELSNSTAVKKIGMSEDCFVTGIDREYMLEDGNIIPLRHAMFDEDAIILTQMSDQIVLKSNKSDKKISIYYPEMKYLSLWHWPRTEAPYICIEPWTSLPSRKGVVENLETQENLVELGAKSSYKNTWVISI